MLKKFFILLFCLFLSDFSFATNNPPQPLDTVPPGVPIDSNLTILILLSICFAFYKFSSLKKSQV